MTEPLFLSDAYAKTAPGVVAAHTPEGGVVLDATIFYAKGGGQPGDSGRIAWDGGAMEVAAAVKGEGGAIVLLPAEAAALPPVGTAVEQRLDWGRRHAHMRMHTALHLLSVAIPLPVTGGQIGAERGRLDFAMPEPVAPEIVQAELDRLVARDDPVGARWIDEAELDARPELVKTLSVQPPRGAGRIRLVRIGPEDAPIDLQPCGGTHVARTGEIGRVRVAKIENKGRQNRRVSLTLS